MLPKIVLVKKNNHINENNIKYLLDI
jgi:hypothetical protein